MFLQHFAQTFCANEYLTRRILGKCRNAY